VAEHAYNRFGLPSAPGVVHVGTWSHEGTEFVALDVATLTAEQARAVARDLFEHADRLNPPRRVRPDRRSTCRYCNQAVVLSKHGWRQPDTPVSAGYHCDAAPRGYHGVRKEIEG
jgi:hypothetical protein